MTDDQVQRREEEVRRTIAEFCHTADSGDYDGWVRLFTGDGVFHMFGQSHVGHAALRAFIEADQPPKSRGLHITTDSVIRFHDGRAVVCSKFLFVASGDTAGVVVAAGTYTDILVPRGERWLFQERKALLALRPATQAWGIAEPEDRDAIS